MGCIREANNLPHSLKLNQSGTPSDTIFRVALYLPLILKLEWKRSITVIKMTAWHGSIRTRPPLKLGVNTVPFAFSSTHRSSLITRNNSTYNESVGVLIASLLKQKGRLTNDDRNPYTRRIYNNHSLTGPHRQYFAEEVKCSSCCLEEDQSR
jgi:hypothetical protein